MAELVLNRHAEQPDREETATMGQARASSAFGFPAKVTAVNPQSRRVEVELSLGEEGHRLSVPMSAMDFEVDQGMELIVDGVDFGTGLDMRILRFRRPRQEGGEWTG
jgi:hypothetical protein